MVNIAMDHGKIVEFCRRHHIRKLAFYGSVLRPDFRPDSDIDILLEFESERVPGFFGLAAMEREGSAILGRKADLRTPEDLSYLFRDEVMARAEVQYAV